MFFVEKSVLKTIFDPEIPVDIYDYIHAMLHFSTNRIKYKEFFKIDFPCMPYPKDKATFWRLVGLGSKMR